MGLGHAWMVKNIQINHLFNSCRVKKKAMTRMALKNDVSIQQENQAFARLLRLSRRASNPLLLITF